MKFYNIATGLFRGFCNIFFKYEIVGMENLPKEGRVIMAANHKSNLDPIFVAAAVKKREISAIAKKELFDIKPLGFILGKLNVIPIDRDKPSISTIKEILKNIKKGYAVGIFPEGTRVPGKEFGSGKAGVAMFAAKGKANIVPVSIISTYKPFSRVKIYVDKPISMEAYFKGKHSNEEYEAASQEIMNVIIKNYCEQADGIVDTEGIKYLECPKVQETTEEN